MSDSKAQMSPAQRIAARLKNSGDGTHPAHSVQQGSGPQRSITNVHEKGIQKAHGGAGSMNPSKENE